MNRSAQFPEVKNIADAVCSDCATPEQLEELERLLTGNFDAQQFYYDYLNMHMHLKSPTDNSMEVIYRRMTEEIVVRPKDNTRPNNTSDFQSEFQSEFQAEALEPRSQFLTKVIFGALFVILCFILILIWQYSNRSGVPIIAHVLKGNVTVFTQQGDIEGNALAAGDYYTEQGATLQLVNSNTLQLFPNTVIKLFNNKEIKLKKGKLIVEPLTNHNTIVHGRNIILHPKGGSLTYDLTQAMAQVTSGENTQLTPLRWRPKHFWGFNGKSDRIIDSAGSAYGIVESGAIRIKGHIGSGALTFDNSANSLIDLGSGGGSALGTGSFSVNEGMTIEALIRPEFSSTNDQVDTIFQKGHGVDGLSMRLSFQHAHDKNQLKTERNISSSLNFGLFILGQDYHELKLPFDGQDGRPSLAEMQDGNFHHIVATYQVKTGLKAIYINGKRHAFYQYPPGSKILSGGPGTAAIGNSPVKEKWHQEAFSGAIDEVAFYDFSLPEFTLREHLRHTRQGKNYFGLSANTQPLPKRPRMLLQPNTTFTLDQLTGLPLEALNK